MKGECICPYGTPAIHGKVERHVGKTIDRAAWRLDGHGFTFLATFKEVVVCEFDAKFARDTRSLMATLLAFNLCLFVGLKGELPSF